MDDGFPQPGCEGRKWWAGVDALDPPGSLMLSAWPKCSLCHVGKQDTEKGKGKEGKDSQEQASRRSWGKTPPKPELIAVLWFSSTPSALPRRLLKLVWTSFRPPGSYVYLPRPTILQHGGVNYRFRTCSSNCYGIVPTTICLVGWVPFPWGTPSLGPQ